MIIPVRNNLTLEPWVPITRTTHLEVAGTNKIRWENPNGFLASWALQVGDTGEEQSEIVILSASTPNGTAGTLTANTLYEHPADTPIFGIKYDQVVFERSTTGTLGTGPVILTNGTVNMAPDQENTIFDDTTGSTSYAYKTMFRASVLGVNSTESDWIIPGGYNPYALGRIRERAKERIFSSKYIKSDLTWNDWANEWHEQMVNAAVNANEAYMIGTEGVSFGTNGYGTITATNFKQVKRIDVTYDGVNWNLSTKADLEQFQLSQTYNSLYPFHVWRGNTVFEIKPASQNSTGGTALVTYYNFGTSLVNDSDELPQPMKPYTKSYVDYMQANAYLKDGKADLHQAKLQEAFAGLAMFKQEITPRDHTGPERVQIAEPTSGDDYFY